VNNLPCCKLLCKNLSLTSPSSSNDAVVSIKEKKRKEEEKHLMPWYGSYLGPGGRVFSLL
jgi:hypothetical protein